MAKEKDKGGEEKGDFYSLIMKVCVIAVIYAALQLTVLHWNYVKRTFGAIGSKLPHQAVLVRGPITVTNDIPISQLEWTRIPFHVDEDVSWSVVEDDTGLDMLINGHLYSQPPKSDPSWTPLGHIDGAVTNLLVKMHPSSIAWSRTLRIERTQR